MTNDDKDLKITSHLDPVFNKPEYKWLNTDALQRAFGEGNNYAVDRMRATPQQPSEPLKELDLELQTARETVGYLKKKASEFKYSEKMSKIFEERSSAVQKLISIFEEE